MRKICGSEGRQARCADRNGRAGIPHLEALARIYTLDEITGYSPTERNRESFVDEWKSKLPFRLRSSDNPRTAIENAEIVSLVTNSLSPVLDGNWLRRGMHINSVQRGELDNRTIERSDVMVIRSRDRDTHWYTGSRAPEEVTFDRSEDPALQEKMRTLGGIVAGVEAGRTAPEQITLFSGSGLGSAGLGIQLLSVATRADEKARKRGLGRELPTDWFSQEIHT